MYLSLKNNQQLHNDLIAILAGFAIGCAICLMLSLSACRSPKTIESVAWHTVHDTATVHDTITIRQTISEQTVIHDTITALRQLAGSIWFADIDTAGRPIRLGGGSFLLNSLASQSHSGHAVKADSSTTSSSHEATSAGHAESAARSSAETASRTHTWHKWLMTLGSAALLAWAIFFTLKIRKIW